MRAVQQRELTLSEYGLIGDGTTAALVGRDGSIDWLCYGRFDGPAVFCRLLDATRGGYFQIAPQTTFRGTQHYMGRTNVLATEFQSARGSIRLTDCMPLGQSEGPVLIRKLEGLAGDVTVRVDWAPTFDFARARTSFDIQGTVCRAQAADAALCLSCPAPMTVRDSRTTSTLRIRAGDTRWFVMAHGSRPFDTQAAEGALAATIKAWERWSAKGNYPQHFQELVRRSALVLKLLIHEPTGAVIAAPTSSLPEAAGGMRNWDYRYSWLRDSSWVIDALIELGYHDESMAYIGWLESLDVGKKAPAVLYDLDGKAPGKEQELLHLRGYRDSRPVRVGNDAVGQDQHDIFGEVVSAVHLCSEGMPSMRPLRPKLWRLVMGLADQAAAHWDHPDAGIWESRSDPRHFLSSKLLCWTALDRALAIAARDELEGPLESWRGTRDRIASEILSKGFDPALPGFKRALDQSKLDASTLLISRCGILPVDDPRVVQTVEAVRRGLTTGKGLLCRYRVADGLPGAQGAFVACSFWLVDCLAQQARVGEACQLFEEVAAYASKLGLFSEEIDPKSGVLLGNYPQALTHLALIRAAVSIARAERSQGPQP